MVVHRVLYRFSGQLTVLTSFCKLPVLIVINGTLTVHSERLVRIDCFWVTYYFRSSNWADKCSIMSRDEENQGDMNVDIPEAALKDFRSKVSKLDKQLWRRTLEKAMNLLALSDDEEDWMGADQSATASSFKPRKLRVFSGGKTLRSGEAEYATWRLYAQPIVQDKGISQLDKRRIIMDSLAPPALELLSSVGSKVSASEILKLLDQHFREVSDGYKLYTQFRSSVQDFKESASEFLQRLHLLTLKTVERGGLNRNNVDLEVLRQFENGCADDDLLQRIGIRGLIKNPPAVAVLLLDVRMEENRRKDKKLRLKARHAHSHAATATEDTNLATQVQNLQQQVQTLYTQLAQFMPTQTHHMPTNKASPAIHTTHTVEDEARPGPGVSRPGSSKGAHNNMRGRGKRKGSPFGFCLNCGETGYFQSACTLARNADLVQQRLLENTRQTFPRLPIQGN